MAGTVVRSVLGPGVHVAAGAVVEDSVVFAHTRIEAGAHVSSAIVDAHVRIGKGSRVGHLAGQRPRDEDVTLVAKGTRLRAGSIRVPDGRR